MLEIIALIFLCKKNGALAVQKGLKPGMWKLYTVLAWIFAEFTGMGFAINAFGQNNLLVIMGIGLFCAFGGYLLIKFILEKKPDAYSNDIDNIGVDDLKP